METADEIDFEVFAEGEVNGDLSHANLGARILPIEAVSEPSQERP